MIDYARPYDQNMCEIYMGGPTTSAPARLDDFQVFKKGTGYIYGNYYNAYPDYHEPEIDTAVYHNLVNSREYRREEWKLKVVDEWNDDDTVSWVIDTAQCMGFSEYDVPFHNFKVDGSELKLMRREEVLQRMVAHHVDPMVSRRLAEVVYEKLQCRLSEEMYRERDSSVFRYVESDQYQHPDTVQTVLDLDSLDHKHRLYGSDYRPNDSSLMQGLCDSSDDTEEVFRSSPRASSEYYGSDGSKSGDEDDKRKSFKRPPGRPKGSGRKICKRPRSVSVPEFLRNLLLDTRYNPTIIKWEDRELKKFRFVKPDEVAKLWGKLKQNDNMTFEKFSRAMRYHYRQSVLVSVPTARLVYQFGPKGPDITTSSSSSVKVKSEDVAVNYS
ncbi:hypothetical protein ABMA27_015018 [Loxostege sticticalis]|uniref:ETS domain-containing protein n=1 Tax=Loxostege sticticalis TaxID=481309 RepID=A0ABR3IAZ1_LOXSC